MFDFARDVLGGVYVVVFITSSILVGLLVGPLFDVSPFLGVPLLLAGIVASMFLAGEVKYRVADFRERREEMRQKRKEPSDEPKDE